MSVDTPIDLLIERELGVRWHQVVRMDPCAYCGQQGATVDHIVPLSQGGPRGASLNGTGCCHNCNRLKADMSLLDFMLSRAQTRDRQRRARTAKRAETRRQRAERLRSENKLNRPYLTLEQVAFLRETFPEENPPLTLEQMNFYRETFEIKGDK
jgi:hypothetical protein